MIPSYFKIEILPIRDEFVTQGHKGLKRSLIQLKVHIPFIVYLEYLKVNERLKVDVNPFEPFFRQILSHSLR